MSTSWLAACNSVYLFTYAICNILSGVLEDRYSLRNLVSGALLSSSFFYILFILLGYLDLYIPALFVIHWGLQGVFQSAIWPGIVAIMGNWFPKSNRGKLMGFWSSNSSVGDIIGVHIGNLIFILSGDWMEVMLPFALFQIVVAGSVFCFLKDRPEDVFSSNSFTVDEAINKESFVEIHTGHKKGIPFLEALFIPGVIPFSLNYACVKFLNYGLLMWLPYFLDHRLEKKEYVAVLASLLDVGGILGSVILGWAGDRLGYRAPVGVLFLALSLPLLLLLQIISQSVFWLYFIVIPATGFFIAGASNVTSSAIPADLAQNPDIENKDEALATVTGIIDGVGGIGAAIGVLTMGLLSTIDWMYVFVFMILTGVASILCILHIAINDIRKLKADKKRIQS